MSVLVAITGNGDLSLSRIRNSAFAVSNGNLPQNFSQIKPAAIWARVSTQDQRETSLPSQVSRCKEKLEQAGYCVIRIFQVDWSSTDLFSCPAFQELCNLIKNRQIDTLAVFDRDRLEAKGLQRLVFLSECKEAGVDLIICQGPPMIDGPEGQIIEMVLALGKERAVLRARRGSKDGLYDRAVKRHKPVTYHRLYGYQWDRVNDRLVPDDRWQSLKLIFDMLLDGKSYHPIIQELKKRGIPSPSGQPEWNKAALSNIVHNPTYAGQYYALKKIAVEPTKRKGTTYGNSSAKKVPLNEAHYLPEIEVIDPPVTWEQQQRILYQLAQHQKLAQRNARRDYLLRGFIFCGTHTGKNGEPRRYHGQPNPHHKDCWRYTCPIGGCPHPHLEGFKLEQEVEEHVWQLLDANVENVIKLSDTREQTKELVKSEISSIQTEYERKINALSQLEIKVLEGEILHEVYNRTKTKLEKRVKWLRNRQDELVDQLGQLSRMNDAHDCLTELSDRYATAWENNELSFEDWQELFSLLNLQICVHPNDVVLEKNNYGDPIYRVPSYELIKCEHGGGLVEKRVDDGEELPTDFPYCEIRFGINVGLSKKIELPHDMAEKAVKVVLDYPERD